MDALLDDHPWLATARFGDPSCHRTLLHAATDWPGKFPNGSAVVARLVRPGADVDAHSRFDSHTKTALRWAASSDDVAVLDDLLDAGADIEASGAVLGSGTALAVSVVVSGAVKRTQGGGDFGPPEPKSPPPGPFDTSDTDPG